MKLMLALLLNMLIFFECKSPGIDEMSINKFQSIGSHNSYKQSIDTVLFGMIKEKDSALARSLDYDHIGLTAQLDLGLRALEIDIYADAKGGKYAHPKGLEWEAAKQQPAAFDTGRLMNEPGFKVFHVPEIDFRSNCVTLKNCLTELKQWSDAHSSHEPVFITMNAKDDTINEPGFTLPEKFTSAIFDTLDNTLLQYLGRDKLIIPDDIRGNDTTLESAVLAGHWPTLASAKGKFIFILDEEGEKRAMYIKNHPSLKNRVLFVNALLGTPEAAFLIINDPVKDQAKIKEMVSKGYLVRTRADADTEEARRNDTSRFVSACSSGAQVISTDYYRKSTHFNSAYKISFDKGTYFRKNPLL